MNWNKLTNEEKENIRYWIINNNPFEGEDEKPYDLESAYNWLTPKEQEEAIKELK